MRNIKLSYAINFLNSSLFWIPIWVFYYLRFTNYAGIGIIESIMIFTSITAEIPTGAIADLLGKKVTLIASFIFRAAGNILMGFAVSFGQIGLAVFIMTIGGALFSGTMESLIYDSLKERGKEDRFDKVIAHTTSIQLIATAIAAILGGYFYTIDVRLPFFALAGFQIIALILCLFLVEPKVDSYTFSFSAYKKQLFSGFGQLFSVKKIKKRVLFLLCLGILFVVSYEAVSDIVLVEFGYTAKEIGILMSIIFLVSAAASQFTPYISRRFGSMPSVVSLAMIGYSTYIVTPILTKFLAGFSNIVRASSGGCYNNVVSSVLNKNIDSRYRATTISTFYMLERIPYLILAYPLGVIMDKYSAVSFGFGLGMIMTVFILFVLLKHRDILVD
ncbi:MFS transporter [Candidatus Woesebacteria bacterium]|nr:MFS transporter [Candidatus Woesebacteria bacterium]